MIKEAESMREILFRGKRVDNGEWVYGYYIKDADFSKRNNAYIGDMFEVNVVDADTVGQFTGLLDKNGNKIFMGDIVSTKYGRLCEVVWFTSPEFNGLDLRPVESEHRAPDKFDLWSNLTVVGNKWDNPELLNP